MLAMPSSLSRRKTVDNAQVPAFPGLKVLHGAWVPSVVGPDRGFFLLWAEGTSSSSSSTRSRKKSGSSEAWHPGLAPPPWLDISSPEKETLLALPTREGRPMPGHPILEEATSALDNGDSPLSLMRWRVKGLTVPPGSNPMAWLLNLPGPETLREQGLLASEDLRFWISAARLSWEMAVGEHFLPAITLEEAGSQFLALWKPLWDHPDMAAKLQVLLKSLPPACFATILNPQKGISPLSAKEPVEGFIA